MMEADCNMAQAFEFPTVSRTTKPRPPAGRSLRSRPRGFPDTLSGSPSLGTTPSCPFRSHEYGSVTSPPQARPPRPATGPITGRFPVRRPATRLINPADLTKKCGVHLAGIDDAGGFPGRFAPCWQFNPYFSDPVYQPFSGSRRTSGVQNPNSVTAMTGASVLQKLRRRPAGLPGPAKAMSRLFSPCRRSRSSASWARRSTIPAPTPPAPRCRRRSTRPR